MKYYDRKLKPLARQLRKNMTDAELLLWSRLKGRQIKGQQFYRQKPLGKYIVDFFCPARRIIIEVDGGQHYEEKMMAKDAARDAYFQKYNYLVLRFTNQQVLLNIDGVLEYIYNEM